MKPQTELAKQAIARSFQEWELSEQQRYDLAFHMPDWVKDLEQFVDFLENPGKYSDNQIQEIILGFVIHAPYHLNKAADITIDGPIADSPNP